MKNLMLVFIALLMIAKSSFAQVIKTNDTKWKNNIPTPQADMTNYGTIKGVIYDTGHVLADAYLYTPITTVKKYVGARILIDLRRVSNATGQFAVYPLKQVNGLNFSLIKRDDISWTYEISHIPLGYYYIVSCIKFNSADNYFPANVGLKGATFDYLQHSNIPDFINLENQREVNNNIEFIKLIPQAPPK